MQVYTGFIPVLKLLQKYFDLNRVPVAQTDRDITCVSLKICAVFVQYDDEFLFSMHFEIIKRFS